MKIPENILKEFEEEIDSLNFYGKVSLSVALRGGGHCHFEIDKHRTIIDEEKAVVDTVNNKEDRKV